MKTYQLKGLDTYTVAFSKEDAVFTFLINKIGVTEKDIIETDITPNKDAIGMVFKTLEALMSYEIIFN